MKAGLREIANRGAPVLANRTLEVARKILDWAIDEEIGGIEVNPCQRLGKPSEEHDRDRLLSDRKIVVFWDKIAETNIKPLVQLALKFQLAPAQRKGEAATAARTDIDREALVWTIPAHHSKNGLPHRVLLSAFSLETLGEIDALSPKSGFLFPSPVGDKAIAATAINCVICFHRSSGLNRRSHA